MGQNIAESLEWEACATWTDSTYRATELNSLPRDGTGQPLHCLARLYTGSEKHSASTDDELQFMTDEEILGHQTT